MNRKKILVQNVSLSVVYKTLGLILSFFTIPILLKYLDKELYGIWVTIFSIINIVFYMDFGVTNGLKTRLALTLSGNNLSAARKDISNAYAFIFAISSLLLLAGSILIYNLNLENIFNTTISNDVLKNVLVITLVLISSSFIFSIYRAMFYAIQKAAIIELSLMVYNFLIIGAVLVAGHYLPKSLTVISIIYGGMQLLIGFVFTFLFFKQNPKLIPKVKYLDFGAMQSFTNLSWSFFVIQLSMIIIFTTDNVIITYLLGPLEVTKYDIVSKLFNTLITVLVIAQAPLWALFSDAFENKDFGWISKTLKNLNLLFFPILILVLLVVMLADTIIKFWIGENLELPSSLTLFMGIFVLIRLYGTIYMSFLNGIGRIRLQMWLYLFGAIINIPLSIFFVKSLDMGSAGVIMGTIASLIVITIALPIQSHKILAKNAVN